MGADGKDGTVGAGRPEPIDLDFTGELLADPDVGTARPADVDVGDELPADLDVTGFVGPYQFPDNKRRRIPGILYVAAAVFAATLWLLRQDGGVLVNEGLLVVAGLLLVAGVYHLVTAAPLKIREVDALVEASRAVGFPVGHASAQLSWRGLLSRPTWRILLYSADEPPTKRGLALVDGCDGRLVAQFVEDNPEDWDSSEAETAQASARGRGKA